MTRYDRSTLARVGDDGRGDFSRAAVDGVLGTMVKCRVDWAIAVAATRAVMMGVGGCHRGSLFV
jgi:hypothetical protein